MPLLTSLRRPGSRPGLPNPDRAHSAESGLPRASLTVAVLSTVVEWYDFTLYLFMATVLSRVIFDGGAASLLSTLALFAIAYLLRPLGALLFGRFGDRFGRRPVLVTTMAIMAAAMLLTAVVPTYSQAGALAGVLFLILRCLMAISVGGEYTTITTYLLEGSQPRRRGLLTSLASAASEIGVLLAVAVAALTTTLLDRASLDSWGWRLPFLFGALLAVITLAARSRLDETPVFAEEAKAELPHSPLRFTLRTQRPALYRTFAISALASIAYYVGIIYVPTYLVSTIGLSEGSSLWVSTAASAAVIAVTPVAGALSDRIGRRTTLLLFCGLSLILPVSMFALMSQGVAAALIGTLVLAGTAGGIAAVSASAAAEQFPPQGRLTGLALGATAATALFGGLTPFAAEWLTQSTGWELIPGVMVAAVALAVLPILSRMPETAPQATAGWASQR
ncbi:MAG: transporter [Pseudarthrobacter sp.]|nr:transporter [Pseudarthrobacter sp.]